MFSRKRQFNYFALIGCVFVLVAALFLVTALRSKDSGTMGIGTYGEGTAAPEFAVPIASSDLDGDANVDPEEACEVGLPDALRICDYFDRPLVISFWFTKQASACIDHQDAFDATAAKFGKRVGFVSINVRDDRARVRELIEEHDWQVPVGYDRDGAVSNIYRVGVCPTFVYVETGGIIKNAEIGSKAVDELNSQVRSLLVTDGERTRSDRD